jgi:pimeloyl-ACP methyl ester carboxylesterase
MAFITTDDGVKLHYEEAGSGTPVVFVHEFAGDARSWEPQMRFFARRYRAIAYNARGYPPSDVPEDPERYSQARARDDIRCVLDALGIARAHIVGLSMGAFATLHFGMAYGHRALSLVVAGGGYGAHPAHYAQFQADSRAHAEFIRREGMARFAATYGYGPTRVQFLAKDPRGFEEFIRHLAEHSAIGSANTLLGYQARRPSLYDLTEQMKAIDVPTLIVAGDEEEPCLEACLLMKRCIATAGLAILPRSGHAINLEEPALFNRLLADFFHQVESGRWATRDPRAAPPSIWGPGGRPGGAKA